MPKANDRNIYEERPWLNDDVQNRTVLRQIVGGGSDITVEEVTFTENGDYTAPAGKAYSPVHVDVAGGSSDFSTVTLTVVNGESESVTVPGLPVITNLTLYDTHDSEEPVPVVLGNTLNISNAEIEAGQSITLSVVAYSNKVLSSQIHSEYVVTSSTGCRVDNYVDENGIGKGLITFTDNTASITIKYID